MYYGSSLIQYVHEARHQFWRAVHSHRARNGLLNTDDKTRTTTTHVRCCPPLVCVHSTRHAHSSTWGQYTKPVRPQYRSHLTNTPLLHLDSRRNGTRQPSTTTCTTPLITAIIRQEHRTACFSPRDATPTKAALIKELLLLSSASSFQQARSTLQIWPSLRPPTSSSSSYRSS
jgi:hypothetical protein